METGVELGMCTVGAPGVPGMGRSSKGVSAHGFAILATPNMKTELMKK